MDEMRQGQAVGEDSEPGFSRYALSCGLLLLPAIAWNLAFTSKLMPPSAISEFWRDIPGPLAFIENLFRVFYSVFRSPCRFDWRRPRSGALCWCSCSGPLPISPVGWP